MGYTQYDKYTSGRREIEKLLNANPNLSFKDLKQKAHGKGVKLKDQTIRNYHSQFRLYSQNGAVPRLHSGFGQLESGFDAGLWKVAPSFERWYVSKNKNRERLWHENEITVGWHRSGTVVFRFKGSRPRGHILGVFSHAFWLVLLSTGRSERELSDFLKALFEEKYREMHHYVFETGQPQPKMKITQFENSLGLTGKLGDGSHRTCVEFEERDPPWLPILKETAKMSRESAEMNMEAAKLFAENIKTHLKVPEKMAEYIEELKKESQTRQAASVDPCARCSKRILHGYQETQIRLFSHCDGQRCSHV